METDSDSIQQASDDTTSTLPGKLAPPSTSDRFWSKLSLWYWAAIIVVGLALFAKLYQDAPQMPPRSSAAATLAPDMELRVMYPDMLSAPLRKADNVPVLVDLFGSGAVTYTIALSSTPSIVYTDRLQQVVTPRMNLSLDPCCQANAVLYPQALPADGIWRQPITVIVYADQAGSASTSVPRLDFVMQREPVWWTFLRRLLLLFADLGLAVAVALAFAGWAFDQQRKREEQQKWEQQREEQHRQAVWQAQLAYAQQKCQHDLLVGVGELMKLRRKLADGGQDESHRIEVERLLESFRAQTESQDSPQHEQILEKAVLRLMSNRALSEDELEAVEYLLGRETLTRENADKGTKEAFRWLGGLVQWSDSEIDIALDMVLAIYKRFGYSMAILKLTEEVVEAWIILKQPSSNEVEQRLHEFPEILQNPRFANIKYDPRFGIYRRSEPQQYRYSWARQYHVDTIAQQLKGMLGIDVRLFHPVPPQRYWGLIPTSQPEQPPCVFGFPEHEDAVYGADWLYKAFSGQQMSSLRDIDGQRSQDSASSTVPTYVPFPVIAYLSSDLDGTEQTERAWLQQFVHALGEEWINLLANNVSVWNELSGQECDMLAALLCGATGANETLRQRFLHAAHCRAVRPQPEKFNVKQSNLDFISDEMERSIRIGNLVRSIVLHAQDTGVNPMADPNRFEMWLTLRPPHMTHTVIVAVMPQYAGRRAGPIWANTTRLVKRLQSHNVLVHLLATQKPPHGYSSLAVEDMSVPKHELAMLFDNAFGYHQYGEVRSDTSENNTEHCKIASLKRLLDDESLDIAADLADALLTLAAGSPSRLFHIIYDVLVNHFADISDDSYETRIAPSEFMRVLQAYKTQTP